MRKCQEIRRIAASIMAAVMMVTAVPFGGAAYGNEISNGGIADCAAQQRCDFRKWIDRG